MARRHAWAQAVARHGALPGIRLADKVLDGVVCIRLDATVTVAHSQRTRGGELQGLWHHPLNAYCDNTGGEPLAWMLRRDSAGSNTAADHLVLLDAAIAALPPGFRRKLMVTAVIRGHQRAVRDGWRRSALHVPPPVTDGLSGDRLPGRQPTAELVSRRPLVVAAFVLPVADASATTRPGQCPIHAVRTPDNRQGPGPATP